MYSDDNIICIFYLNNIYNLAKCINPIVWMPMNDILYIQ